MTAPGVEHGDRASFLAEARRRLGGSAFENLVHPPPPPLDAIPELHYSNLDEADLVGSFERSVRQAAGTCQLVATDVVPDEVLVPIVEALGERTAVVSNEPEAVATGVALARLGVDVAPYDPRTGADASLGVTSAVSAIAATGSVVLDARRSGGRGASLLPPVHLCVVPAGRIVATPGAVFRALTGNTDVLPSNLVLVTGPSRTGDIEQLLTLGVHGPVALHVVVLGVRRVAG